MLPTPLPPLPTPLPLPTAAAPLPPPPLAFASAAMESGQSLGALIALGKASIIALARSIRCAQTPCETIPQVSLEQQPPPQLSRCQRAWPLALRALNIVGNATSATTSGGSGAQRDARSADALPRSLGAVRRSRSKRLAGLTPSGHRHLRKLGVDVHRDVDHVDPAVAADLLPTEDWRGEA